MAVAGVAAPGAKGVPPSGTDYPRPSVRGSSVFIATGHRFVELGALVVANGTTPLARCYHIAIYQPREQAAA